METEAEAGGERPQGPLEPQEAGRGGGLEPGAALPPSRSGSGLRSCQRTNLLCPESPRLCRLSQQIRAGLMFAQTPPPREAPRSEGRAGRSGPGLLLLGWQHPLPLPTPFPPGKLAHPQLRVLYLLPAKQASGETGRLSAGPHGGSPSPPQASVLCARAQLSGVPGAPLQRRRAPPWLLRLMIFSGPSPYCLQIFKNLSWKLELSSGTRPGDMRTGLRSVPAAAALWDDAWGGSQGLRAGLRLWVLVQGGARSPHGGTGLWVNMEL